MTTFDERLRALVWGRELLEGLVADPSTPEERRKLAAQLLDGYPVASSIETSAGGSRRRRVAAGRSAYRAHGWLSGDAAT